MSQEGEGEEGGNEVHLGLPCRRQKEEVKSIGNPAGIGKGTGFGLRERERDGIGLGHYRLRASRTKTCGKRYHKNCY